MHISEDTLDDLMHGILSCFLASTTKQKVSSSRGNSWEIDGVLLELTNPLYRLSRTDRKSVFFSCLGELIWYLSGNNAPEQITYYIPKYKNEIEEDGTINGAYGPRIYNLRGINQFDNVIELLKRKPQSRRAVIQLFLAEDLITDYKDIPCTCNIQFLIREEKLNMYVQMRSNDVFVGLPHDVFAFTMIQEILAKKLGKKLGVYKHYTTSLHLYETDEDKAKQFLDEGFQDKIAMPEMPIKNIDSSIKFLIDYEGKIRENDDINLDNLEYDSYWLDLVKLLLILKKIKVNKLRDVVTIKNSMRYDIYETYIRKRTT